MKAKNKTSVSCSLVGLPNVGKSTLFNVLTNTMAAAAANFPFCTIDPNIGCCFVRDERLYRLAEISKSVDIVFSQLKIVDVAGLVNGASEGAGLGNQFLSHVRETDLIIEVVRAFDDINTTHVMGRVSPLDDIDIIETEFLLADLKMAQDIKERLLKKSKSDPNIKKIVDVLDKLILELSNGVFIKNISLSESDEEIVYNYNFLTLKPVIYALNVSESDIKDKNKVDNLVSQLNSNQSRVVLPFCASLEEMCINSSNEDKKLIFNEYGYTFSSDEIIKRAFSQLGLISFFTSGVKESRSWTIVDGTCAQEAAGKIHNDIEKGFIRAEVVSYSDFCLYEGRNGAKEKGVAKLVGREYLVNDGDVILFLHKI